jgi:hypothetical protein
VGVVHRLRIPACVFTVVVFGCACQGTEARDHGAACSSLHGRQEFGLALDLRVAANSWDGGDGAAFEVNMGDWCSSQELRCEGKGSR